MPHQNPWTVGRLSSASSLGPLGQGQDCASSLQQHDSGDIHQQGGGTRSPSLTQIPEVVQGLGYQASRLPHPS